MDPMILSAIIGGGASIAGGFMGAGAQQDANDKNWQINLLNYYSRERERRDRIRAAEQADADRKLGATDASGNRVHFVPGKGWVTDLSAQSESMKNAQDAEQMRVLNQDLPAKRKQMFENLRGADEARYLAEGVQSALKRDKELDSVAGARTKLAADSASNNDYDNLVNALSRKSTRMGSSNYAQIAQEMNKNRSATQGSQAAQLQMAGEQSAAGVNSAKRGGLLNLLSALQARGAGMPQVSYAPQNTTGTANSLLSSNQSLGANADNQVIAAYGQKGGTVDYTQPNMGWANVVSLGGQAFAGGLDNLTQRLREQKSQNSGF